MFMWHVTSIFSTSFAATFQVDSLRHALGYSELLQVMPSVEVNSSTLFVDVFFERLKHVETAQGFVLAIFV